MPEFNIVPTNNPLFEESYTPAQLITHLKSTLGEEYGQLSILEDEVLGKGSDCIVFRDRGPSLRVVKVTQNIVQAHCARRITGDPDQFKGLVNCFGVTRVCGDLFVIKERLLCPINDDIQQQIAWWLDDVFDARISDSVKHDLAAIEVSCRLLGLVDWDTDLLNNVMWGPWCGWSRLVLHDFGHGTLV